MKEDTRLALVAPFPEDAVSTRKGTHGKTLQYIETWRVIDRLNQAFGHDWSFRILEWRLLDAEVIVHAELAAGGLVKQAFGSSTITRSKETGDPTGIGDDVKAAASDALKKAATLLGVGLELYAGKGEEMPETRPHAAPPRRSSSNGRLTDRQAQAILAVAKLRGMSEPEIRTRILDDFGVTLEQLGRREASELISKLNNGTGRQAQGGAA
jgi:hypothetical protein